MTISFARGIPGPDLLPVDELADCAQAALRGDGRTILSYGSTLGDQPLRDWIGERHGVEPGRGIVTNGSLQAFHLVLATLEPGRVLVARPTYDRPRRVLAAELEPLVASTYITPALLAQATVHEFFRRGLFERNLERVCGLLRERRDAMLEALERELAGRARWNRPGGGYFLWLDLAEGVDASELLGPASEAGVTFVPGADFGGPPNSLPLAFSFVSPAEIDQGGTPPARPVSPGAVA